MEFKRSIDNLIDLVFGDCDEILSKTNKRCKLILKSVNQAQIDKKRENNPKE